PICEAGRALSPVPRGDNAELLESVPEVGVHPRTCGADVRAFELSADLTGPSPRLRGRSTYYAPSAFYMGSIPAPAGPIPTHQHIRIMLVVHPRACGADVPRLCTPCPMCGPSPRLRGRYL